MIWKDSIEEVNKAIRKEKRNAIIFNFLKFLKIGMISCFSLVLLIMLVYFILEIKITLFNVMIPILMVLGLIIFIFDTFLDYLLDG